MLRASARPSSHADSDFFDHGFRLARREFECDGPARGLRAPAETLLLRHGIHFGDHAVDFIRQRIALRFPFFAELDQRLRCPCIRASSG